MVPPQGIQSLLLRASTGTLTLASASASASAKRSISNGSFFIKGQQWEQLPYQHQHQHRHQYYNRNRNLLLQQHRYYHFSPVVSSNTITRIQSFKRDEDGSLHFIISSKGSNVNGDENENKGTIPTKIFSPALFLSKESDSDGVGTDIDTKEYNPLSSSIRDEVIDDISAAVESHYTLDDRDQFVGGMGENDGGVWFVVDGSSSNGDEYEYCDTLDYWEHIRDVISSIKQNRHGIPFGIYTSGLVKDQDIANDLKGSIGISSLQVTLGSGDPISYGQVVGLDGKGSQVNSAFGDVCNFIVSGAESGFPVTVSVAGGKHAGPGSELAKALGAVDVVVYDQVR
mmetsp:Transcript_3651/g.4486  ORF Transcript_3651/g.4486 Transcript_3651/m.4486 type:complete len:341 (+) Transcript_3651:191-1213(+)|eukprot:CAMPEP_0203683872 /NCGR_PEP_ID=MMETSP0090-20130426/47744_1 /ASSEMBLY_ACC=CAM_ASM_001088 /TAXON_ID=426623 /ORGANISM="Chaetoceros affinis, Strain CCMP159" /LENGTH=340 /DNA_ID=CAMNT_0050553029 /DNA_START=2724 /DNA_END=3749 /DNA_ORIENTATION=-